MGTTCLENGMRKLGVEAMRFWPLLILGLCAWTGAFAECACQKDTSPLEQQVRTALGSADYVALVRVKSTQFEIKSYDENYADWNPKTRQSEDKVRHVEERILVASFEPVRVYKGPNSAAQLETSAKAGACGIDLAQGSTYLVYAYGEAEPIRVSTSRCERTALQANAAKDIEVLDSATKPKSVVAQMSGTDRRFLEAMDLVHSHRGGGDERWGDPKLLQNLSEASQIADELAASDPLSGFSQVIRSELTSTWRLRDNGKPVDALQEALLLTEDALRIAPNFAPAHVARALTLAKSGRLKEAEAEIQRALQLDPQLTDAIWVQAEISRLSGSSGQAERWIRNFIAADSRPLQKANGWEWLARMDRDIAYKPQPYNRDVYLQLANAYFWTALGLDPNDPWRMTQYARFLNEFIGEFGKAEKYAAGALVIEDIPAAHDELAAAQYQALLAKAEGMNAAELQTAATAIEAATGRSLESLLAAGAFRDVVTARLMRLQRRLRS